MATYKVIVADGEFAEAGSGQDLLAGYHGKKLLLPKDLALWPNPIHIAWHRKTKFHGT